MKFKLFVLLLFFTSLSHLKAADLAYIDKVFHIGCDEKFGYIEMGLLSDDIYQYYFEWTDANGDEHKEETLILDNLPVGDYTFYVEDIFGCKQIIEIPIYAIYDGNITATTNHINNTARCKRILTVQVFYNGEPIPEEHLIIKWDDHASEGLTRIINDLDPLNLCVDIYLPSSDGGYCATTSACFNLIGIECDEDGGGGGDNIRPKGKIIVNEFNRSSTKGAQFVELLVVGNGICGESMDIRGYHIDDNNGTLIPPSDMITAYNTDFLGITPGAIFFSYDDNWSEVPNGSLIVVYDEEGLYSQALTNDPTDSDDDAVYILPSNSDYFLAKETPWNVVSNEAEYTGTLIDNSWELIKLNTSSDGMQVRSPQGEYVHGVSLGTNSFGASNNDYDLWITDESATDCNCNFINLDPFDKTHFECEEAALGGQTPGLANSTDNQTLINSLKDCGAPQIMPKLSSDTDNSLNANTIHAYPNPFTDIVNVDIASNLEGEAELELFTGLGQIIKSKKVHCSNIKSVVSFDLNLISATVVYVRVKFPDGETQITRVIKIKE